MTYEDKQLLLADLCARLPFNTIVTLAEMGIDGLQWYNMPLNTYHLYQIEEENAWEYIKPYLRSMSSMTDEELVDYKLLEKQCEILPTFAYISVSKCVIFDWLNKHHFDYRGLIEKDLAIEAPKGMYY